MYFIYVERMNYLARCVRGWVGLCESQIHTMNRNTLHSALEIIVNEISARKAGVAAENFGPPTKW